MSPIRSLPLLLLASLAIAAAPASAPAPAADPFAALTFRSIGPNSGRLDAAAGVPGDPSVYYVAGLGGLFKSTNGGASYSSVFDEPDVSSVGAIAVAPSNPSVVYVGTGEPNIRNDIEPGDGVWRSDDAGKTWVHVGLEGTAHIAQIAIDPHDANVVYVAAEGRIYANNADRGIYKTTDGGKTWQHVLAIDDTTGASAVAIDPANPNTVLAGAWTIWRRPWTMNSGGPNDGLYMSHDAGAHWTRLEGHGLPGGLMGRIGLAYAPSQPARIYALIESQDGVLYRSDDGGATWQSINTSHEIWQRPFYFFELTVDPHNADHVFFPSVSFYETVDGGKTVKRANGLGDNHQVWIDPENSSRMIMAADGGAGVSLDGGKTWIYAQIPISQVYHLDTDDRNPYTVCVEIQDSGSACGPSNSKIGGILPGNWYATFGGESGWTLFDPANPNYIYGSGYTGALTRFDRHTHQALSIAPWPEDVIGWAARDERYRFQWTAPIAVSKLEPRALYFGGNVLFKSEDEGLHWHVISPDLTRNDKSKQGPTGGPISHDATSVETYDTIFTIAESPLRRGELWVGTDDGLVWLTRDDGKHWENLTAHIPEMPEWARVISLTPSWFDPASAYLAVDTHLLGVRAPYLWVTHDYGAHWRSIAGTLTNASYALVLKEDPLRRGMLYLGTGTGLYVSYDDGSTWRQLHNGLPTVPVYDLMVQRQFDDLVVGTHGGGVYIMDDIRALQDDRPEVTSKALALYPARTAYRYGIGKFTYEQENQSGDDPPDGAIVDFWLRDAPAKDEKVAVRIYEGSHLIRTIDVKKPVAGVNRVVWNLRYEGFKAVTDSDPWAGGGFTGPLAVPGAYRVAVSAGAQSATGSVRIAEDPSLHVSDAALREQFEFQMRIHNDLRLIGDEIDALRTAKKAHPDRAAAIEAALDGLFQPLATQGEDVLRYPVHVYEQLSSLSTYAESVDAAPTEADHSVLVHLESEMRSALDRARAVLRTMPSSPKPHG
jgi:photosystem II stability/assembly factor-like uncharacterized protein